MVTQLRAEAQQLKDTNGSLEDKIKELKVRQPYIHCASIHTIFYNPKAYKS
jgi:cell division protein FtsB